MEASYYTILFISCCSILVFDFVPETNHVIYYTIRRGELKYYYYFI